MVTFDPDPDSNSTTDLNQTLFYLFFLSFFLLSFFYVFTEDKLEASNNTKAMWKVQTQ